MNVSVFDWSLFKGFDDVDKVFLLAQANALSPYAPLLMMVGIIAIFYFLMIRPQQKRQKELKAQIAAIAKGDKILTIGGIYAEVVQVKEDRVFVKVVNDVKFELSKTAIASVIQKA